MDFIYDNVSGEIVLLLGNKSKCVLMVSVYSGVGENPLNLVGDPHFHKVFFRTVNRCAELLHLPSTNAYQRIWQHMDAAWVCCCCCPSFHVSDDFYVHSVIIESQCVSNEKFNETLFVDQGQDLKRIMKSPISSHIIGCFSS